LAGRRVPRPSSFQHPCNRPLRSSRAVMGDCARKGPARFLGTALSTSDQRVPFRIT
jgi:hypothetical protein